MASVKKPLTNNGKKPQPISLFLSSSSDSSSSDDSDALLSDDIDIETSKQSDSEEAGTIKPAKKRAKLGDAKKDGKTKERTFSRLKRRADKVEEAAESEDEEEEKSNFNEEDLDIDDIDALDEALSIVDNEEESDADSDEESDDDSFIVDNDDFASLAASINNKEAWNMVSNVKETEKQRKSKEAAKQSKGKKRKRGATKIEEWLEDMEKRRAMRVTHLRQLAERNPALQKQLANSATERKNLYGSKLAHHPLGLIGKLFFHQMVAIAWCLLREALAYKGMWGGILADEMGVGKTSTMLGVISFDAISGYTSHKRNSEIHYYPPTLIVCPNSLIKNWVNEARERFEPSALQIVILNEKYTKDWQSSVSQRRLVESDLVIINYDTLRSVHSGLLNDLAADIVRNPSRYNELVKKGPMLDELELDKLQKAAETLAEKNLYFGFKTIWRDSDTWLAHHFLYGYHFRRVVFDECTQFKNYNTKVFQSVLDIQAERVWALSGTPLENNMDEMYSQMRVLGVDRSARSISDVKRWHHFLKLEKGTNGKSTNVPTPEVITRIKRRFINVLQIRREFQNPNPINPLRDYITRFQESTSQAWDTFVDARTMAKSERALHRRGDAFVDDPMDDLSMDGRNVMFNRPLNVLTEERLTNSDQESIWSLIQNDLEISDGFYWYTRQSDFRKAFTFVNSLLRRAFDTSIEQLSEAIDAARNIMAERKLSSAVLPKDQDDITDAIGAVMDRGKVNTGLRGKISVFHGILIPKPLIFVAKMHKLEDTMYKSSFESPAPPPLPPTSGDMMEIDDEDGKTIAPTPKKTTATDTAFNAIQKARACCGDYRSPSDAVQKLTQWRGTHWDNPKEQVEDFETDKETIDLTQEDLIEGASSLTGQAPIDPQSLLTPALKAPTVRKYSLPSRNTTKSLMLLRYIKSIPEDDKVVVFSDLVSFFPRLNRFLNAHGVKTCMVTGKTKIGAERDTILDQFKSTKPGMPRVLLASLKCLGQGQNLQVANHVIIFNPWWNGAFEEQAKHRVARPGQLKTIYIVYFALLGTIDELVLSKAGMKEVMITSVIGKDDGVVLTSANFTRPDVNDSHLMEFETSATDDYVIPLTDMWEESLGDLLKLPKAKEFGKTFANVDENDLISASGRLNQVHLAEALTQIRTLPISFGTSIMIPKPVRVIDLTVPAPLPQLSPMPLRIQEGVVDYNRDAFRQGLYFQANQAKGAGNKRPDT